MYLNGGSRNRGGLLNLGGAGGRPSSSREDFRGGTSSTVRMRSRSLSDLSGMFGPSSRTRPDLSGGLVRSNHVDLLDAPRGFASRTRRTSSSWSALGQQEEARKAYYA
ncbi:unnamed protein product, partial [Amoebophrya sp. A25]|eukprot:GSA25T00003417001.1